MKHFFLGAALCAIASTQAQVSQYSVAIDSGWVDPAAPQQLVTIYDDVILKVPLGFTLNYEGTDFDSLRVSANGFAWMGDDVMNSFAIYDPLTYNWDDQVVLSVFAADLHNNMEMGATTAIEYAVVGTAPNRQCVITWVGANLILNLDDPALESFDFQLVIHENGTFGMAYQNCFYRSRTLPADDSVQVGIRDGNALISLEEPLVTIGNPWANPTVDTAVTFGMPLYFRLPDTPANGMVPYDELRYVFSPVINSIPEPTPEVNVAVYPNPSRDRVRISGTEMIRYIRLVDLTGSVVYASTVQARQHTVAVEQLPSGLYLLQAELESGRVVTEKVVRGE